MVTTRFLLDDKSPLIQYDTNFLATEDNSNLVDANNAAFCYRGTYTNTNVASASLTWSFNGTVFTVWGATSPSHGNFTYSIDGGPNIPATANSGLLYQQPLVVVGNLTQGTHTLKITNDGVGSTPNLDVDMITFESELQIDDSGPLVASITQDTDSRFQYSSSWNTSPMNVSSFSNGSGHATTTPQSSVTLSFTGAVISLFGSVSPNNGQYQIQLDGAAPQLFNGTSWDTFTQVMLYHANDIGDMPHELVIFNQPTSSTQNTLTIDYAEVLSSYANSGNPTPDPVGGPQTSSSQSPSKGYVAGLAVTSGIALLGILSTLFTLRQNRKLKRYQRLMARPYAPAPSDGSDRLDRPITILSTGNQSAEQVPPEAASSHVMDISPERPEMNTRELLRPPTMLSASGLSEAPPAYERR